jgi:hypothetical protein
MLRRGFPGWLVLALVALAAPAIVNAQSHLGAIQGTVTDASGAILPGVTVTVTNLDTGISRTTVSNQTGVYRVQSLDPGRYTVSADLQSFRRATRTDVVVSTGATLGINFTMQPGSVEETVEVVGTPPDIQTERAEVSSIVEQKKITDLPLVGRNCCR